MQGYEIFQSKPEVFDTRLQGSGCFCAWEDKLLFLKRHPQKEDGSLWCLPGGKAEKRETPVQTAARELYEETGIFVEGSDLYEMGAFYIRLPKLDYVFHTFYKKFHEKPLVHLALDEHTEGVWCKPQEALALPLLRGAKELLVYYIECKKAFF